MTLPWHPYREPLRTTVIRTVAIAVVVGGVVSLSMGAARRWPAASLLMLWPSFGGHWLEIGFLNWLRPRLPSTRAVQMVARLLMWFGGGVLLGMAMVGTSRAFGAFQLKHWPPWWVAGIGFIGVELAAHVGLQLRGMPSFYNGRG